jgi:hypothetical protein
MKKKEINKDQYVPRTEFQTLVNKLGINEDFTIKHKRQKKYNKFINNTALYEGYNVMCDLLILPETSENYRYLLTVLDLGTNKCDFEPLKNKEANSALTAIKKIFNRKIVNEPDFSISTDNGSEFKGVFSNYFKQKGIYQKFSMPYRHSQQSPVESLNGQISRILLGYLNNVETETQKKYYDWTDILDKVRTELNKHRERKNLEQLRLDQPSFDLDKAGEPNYKVGEFVHYLLNKPMDALNNPINSDSFRKGDFRYSPTVHKITKILYMNDEPYYRFVLSELPNVSFSSYQLIKSDKKEETYLVKKLLDKRKQNKKVYYLVWWKGYLKKDATWTEEKTLLEDGFKEEIDNYNSHT